MAVVKDQIKIVGVRRPVGHGRRCGEGKGGRQALIAVQSNTKVVVIVPKVEFTRAGVRTREDVVGDVHARVVGQIPTRVQIVLIRADRRNGGRGAHKKNGNHHHQANEGGGGLGRGFAGNVHETSTERKYITPAPLGRASNGGRSDVAVAFVVGFSDPRPDAVHEFIVVLGTVVESAVRFTERVGFLSRGDEITFGRETRDNGAFFATSREVAHRLAVHGIYSV